MSAIAPAVDVRERHTPATTQWMRNVWTLTRRNFIHVMQFVDGIVTVTEEEIRSALRIILTATTITAEPSGAVTLAAALFHARELPKAQKVVAIVSGGNLDPALRAEVLQNTV